MSERNLRRIRSLRRVVQPLTLVLFLLPALVPLLRTTVLPCTHDNIFHGFRIVALRALLRHGWTFSRWVPNLALGYGYPFFNYREPLPYLVGAGLHAAGMPVPLVLGLLYAGGLIGAAWGAFVLARDLFGERAAWVAAVAYGLGPYLLLDPLRRGNMPESVALALLPWLFVTTRRIVRERSRRAFLVTVVLLVALFLSHNISSLLLAPFLGLYVTLLAWLYRDRGGWPFAYAAVAVGVLLAAWFWLPALAEQDMVQLHLSRTTRNNDFHYNFVSWREMLLTPPAPYDAAYLNPPMRIALGVGQGALALLGIALGLWPRRRSDTGTPREARETRLLVGLFAVAAFAYLWMAAPGSVTLWERFELLSFVQFPWRLVGRALLPVSLLAGLAVETVLTTRASGRRRHLPRWLAPGLLGGVLVALSLLAWPDTYPPKGVCPSEPYPDLRDLYALEQDGWIGMDPESSYFPVWVETHPRDTALAEAFAEGRLPERFDATTLPAGGEVVSADDRLLGATLTVRSPAAFQARWLGLYFPGWQVTIDGQRVAATPADDTGLLTFPVPAGEHEVVVRFGSTAVRRLGVAMAVLGGLVLVGLLRVPRLWLGRRAGAEAGRGAPGPAVMQGGGVGQELVLMVVALLLVGVRYFVVGQVPTPVARGRLSAEAQPEVVRRLDQDFEGGLTLVGTSPLQASLPADGELGVDLLWQARSAPGTDYRTSVLLRGVGGQVWSPAGTVRPRGYETPPPTSGWAPGAYAYDPHIVTPLPGTPPGTYEVIVVAFDAQTLSPASVLDANGQPLGPEFVLGTVTLDRPATRLTLDALDVPADATLARCGDVGLWAMRLDRATGTPGDVVAVRWVWEALAAPSETLTATLHLTGPDDTAVTAWHLPPVAAGWATQQWQAGDRWIGQPVVRLPGHLETGTYRLAVTVPGCDTPLAQAELAVVAPERTWTVPAELAPAEVTFGDRVTLAGYEVTLSETGEDVSVDVELAWQAATAMERSYHVFVHLVDAGGQMLGQSDGIPAGWTRPTTGWAEGEVVTERRTVTLPSGAAAGPFTLRVGLYEPGGSRLLTPDGMDGYTLATWEGVP